MKRSSLTAAFILLAFLATAPVAAQSLELGPRFGGDVDQVQEAFIGLDTRISVPVLPFIINPGFDVYLRGGEQSFFTFDANVLVPFGVDTRLFTPYTGGGLLVTRFSNGATDTSVGAQVLAGATFNIGALKPFVQARASFGASHNVATVSGGLLFTLGR